MHMDLHEKNTQSLPEQTNTSRSVHHPPQQLMLTAVSSIILATWLLVGSGVIFKKHIFKACDFCSAGDDSKAGLSLGAIIAIAVVGGLVLMVVSTIIFCCCRARWNSKAAAVEAAIVAKQQPPKQALTPTAAEPFAVNYPQFSVSCFKTCF